MKHFVIGLLTLSLMFVSHPAAQAAAPAFLEKLIVDDGFFVAVAAYYGVPQSDVILIRDRGIPIEEIPAVYLIARRARIAPLTVVNFRLGGRSWLDVTLHFGLSPEIYYVPVSVPVTGPPYGKAYGYYKNKPRKEWKTIRLGDDDVINLANLRFISEHYHYPAADVIRLRSGGRNFVSINTEVKGTKGPKGEKTKASGQQKGGKAKDSEKQKNNGKGTQKGHGKKN